MGTLARFSQILADFEHVIRRAQWVEEDGQQVFRGGQNRGEWYYKRLFNYLQHYALDAYEDFEGEDTFDLDVVDILTVHQAKGWNGRWSSCLPSWQIVSRRRIQGSPAIGSCPKGCFRSVSAAVTRAVRLTSVACSTSR